MQISDPTSINYRASVLDLSGEADRLRSVRQKSQERRDDLCRTITQYDADFATADVRQQEGSDSQREGRTTCPYEFTRLQKN